MMKSKLFRSAVSLLMAVVLCALTVIPVLAEIWQRGASGDQILAIQQRLQELGYTETETDGHFGEGTEKALVRFQQSNDLLATGMADETTVAVLMSEAARGPLEEELATEDVEAGAVIYDTEDNDTAYMSVMATSLPKVVAGATSESTVWDTREYSLFAENGFVSTAASPLSTFAADVDTASWTQVRQALLAGEEVNPDSVRVEEMLNYFHYDYNQPLDGEPFGVTMELADCPWNSQTRLLLIGLQAETIEVSDEPKNLVFLIDVSGSMDDENKLPLVKRSFLLLLDTLAPTDTVSIVTYASQDEVVLDGVPAADKNRIMEAINGLTAGGGTNGAAGITTAYQLAEKHLVTNGINRILLATDGDLNIGVTSEGELARLVMEKKQGGVSLTCLGFGGWNYKDNRMEALADYGDGNYWYIDSLHEARRALVTEAGGTFRTVARDVKLQLDFNPAMVSGYRLIGYEDRLLAAEDFANDSVDGGEIGSGHCVTALYELVLTGSDFDFGGVSSRYVTTATTTDVDDEYLTLSIRAKAPDSGESTLYTYPLKNDGSAVATDNLTFAAAVAQMAMLLRDSRWKGTATWESTLDLLRGCGSVSGDVYKEELVYLVGLMVR